ncbi:MAG: TIGR03986 family CRISPR-associated RAMP protein [Clostridiales bacterium]|nr:TIGR03986 family CRISPR-associated RAMP protein [Clostridiales bacterium]MCF8021288.1 TIGR03986 family CRISPR-associated RAMP protein [Clostridiales bacterium]
MEDGKICVSRTKKGKLDGKIHLENGKIMPVPPHYKIEESLNDKDCQIERQKGQIVNIIIDGKELKTKENQVSTQSSSVEKKEHAKQKKCSPSKEKKFTKKSAKAPYNFIPLNNHIVESSFKPEEVFTKIYHKEKLTGKKRLTGKINLELETKTPLYIRDTSNWEKEEDNINPEFFSPGGRYKIPGSSLRGMTRTLVEIISWGKFSFFDNKLLYYREVAVKSSLNQEYQRNMISRDGKKFNAGYLIKEGVDNYYIIPAQKENGIQFKQINKKEIKASLSNQQFTYHKREDGKYLVFSGNMPYKEHHWLINPPDFEAHSIPIEKDDIEKYSKDENRYSDNSNKNDKDKQDGDLLRQLRVSEEGIVPCFYVHWKDSQKRDRISFGHTGYFRLAYKKTIGDHIPDKLKNEDKIDLAEAIFGKESYFASRVSFEDAELVSGQNNILMEKVSPKILSTPKPTTFQHYLEQDTDDIKQLKHWNDEVNIRGYKLYWHKNINNNPNYWQEDAIKDDTQHTVIKPIKPGMRFKGNIRFENLSEIELGALLFALDLPDNHYHKIGMGKPLGLGSVKINTNLIISDREKRYEKLFSGNDWELGEKEQPINKYKDKFEKFILAKLKEFEEDKKNYEVGSLWETERLKQLRIILDWSNTLQTEWLSKTDYMELDQFKNRPVLPKPEVCLASKKYIISQRIYT